MYIKVSLCIRCIQFADKMFIFSTFLLLFSRLRYMKNFYWRGLKDINRQRYSEIPPFRIFPLFCHCHFILVKIFIFSSWLQVPHNPAILPHPARVRDVPLLLREPHAGAAHGHGPVHQEAVHQVHLPQLLLHPVPDAAGHGEPADRVPDCRDPRPPPGGRRPAAAGHRVGEDGARLPPQLRGDRHHPLAGAAGSIWLIQILFIPRKLLWEKFTTSV